MGARLLELAIKSHCTHRPSLIGWPLLSDHSGRLSEISMALAHRSHRGRATHMSGQTHALVGGGQESVRPPSLVVVSHTIAGGGAGRTHRLHAAGAVRSCNVALCVNGGRRQDSS